MDHKALFDALGLEAGDTLFVHASADRMRLDVAASSRLLEELIERVGSQGTLAMPSYT